MCPKIPRQKRPAPYSKTETKLSSSLHQKMNSIYRHAYTPCTLPSFHTTSSLPLIISTALSCSPLFKKRAQFGYLIR